MSFEWKKYTIADVSKKVVTGKTPPGTLEKYFGGDVLFVTPTDMGDNKYIERTQRTLSDEGEAKLAKQRFECGIVVSCIGWQMGKSAIVKNAAVTNQQINTIIPNNELIDVDFLYYILSDKRTEIFNLGATATRTPILKKTLFEKIEFYAPKLEHQKKIGSILSCLDNKIINNQKINQTLEQMANALFKSWFVDFEPVKAKIAVLEAGGSQEDATLAAMTAISGKDADALVIFEREHPEQYAELEATAELFPSAMQDSEFGEIPEGWSCKPISQIVMVKSGYAFKSKEFTDSGFPVIKIKNITRDGTVDVDDCQFVTSETVQGLDRFVIKNGDVLLAMTGATVGKVGIFFNNGFPAYLNQRVAKFECRKGFNCNWFVYNIVSRSDFTSQILSTAQGSAQPNISAKEIENISRVIPLDSLIIAYENCASKLYQFVMSNILENSLLTQIRDTLLPKLISGEITLPEAEQAVSEVENV
ncbi:TPA: restriction endonuclease subunit S [Serratia fonticola]